MKRISEYFPVKNISEFKNKALEWAYKYEAVCYLDNNGHHNDTYHRTEGMLAVGIKSHLLHTQAYGAFKNLREFYEMKKDWLFGFITYDVKNDTEKLESKGTDGPNLPEMHFFQPTHLIEFDKEGVKISSTEISPSDIFTDIISTKKRENSSQKLQPLLPRIPKEEYINTVKKVKQHIQAGDIYEMNFCQEFYAENIKIDPLSVFQQLNRATKTPFASFYKLKNRFLICASPERFLQKKGNKLISQPIKGTAPRSADAKQDAINKQALYNSKKDRSENVMIVDLVRNDLARSCKAGTVKAEELYGIYGFENVWQMISTITGELRADKHFAEAIKLAYPMGSMTGAPKIRAMELIEKYEKTKRGLYSGTVGYITPEGDFDFNVVIRSLIYNASDQYLSFQVGGAIVDASDPNAEYEECLLKGKNIFDLL